MLEDFYTKVEEKRLIKDKVGRGKVQLCMIRFISINDTRSQQTLLSIPLTQQRHLLEEFFISKAGSRFIGSLPVSPKVGSKFC